MWGNDLELSFLDQDEVIILADFKNLTMFLDAIDNSNYIEHKIDTLTESVCILLYSYTVAPEEYYATENIMREQIAKQVRPELIKRKQIIIQSQAYVDDYIKEVIHPQLGIEVNGQSPT